jgi:hypothetical protein
VIILKSEFISANGSFNGKKKLSEEIINSINYHTNFLDYDAPNNVRVSYILHGIKQQLKCSHCNLPIRLITKLKSEFESRFCSLKCRSNSDSWKKKVESTVHLRYGVSNVFQSDVIKEKISNTNLEKYGVSNPSHCDDIKEKISAANKVNATSRIEKSKKTYKSKTGYDHPSLNPEIIKKRKKTNLERYGSESYLTSIEGKEQITKSIVKKYNVSNSSQSEIVKERIKSTKFVRYGDSNYNNRDKASTTMKERYGGDYSARHISEQSKNILSDATELTKLISRMSLCDATKLLGISIDTLYKYLSRHKIDIFFRKNQYEDVVKFLLKLYNIEYKRNNRSILKNRELDFYLPKYNIAFEINGIYWHSELMGKDKNYHLDKTIRSSLKGIKVIHLWDYQFDNNIDLVKGFILNKLGLSTTKIDARKTQIVEIDSKTYKQFLKQHHLQGPANSSIRYGLMFNDTLVSVMGIGKSRFKKDEHELIRYAVKTNCSIRGGFSKLLKHVIKSHLEIYQIISYASRDISDGDVYLKNGFVLDSYTSPGYTYFKNREIFNRLQFQKHKLTNKLINYDSNLTEWENMKNNGFNRFWDTGNGRYVYTRN